GAALGLVQYFAENRLSFPPRHYGGSRDGQLAWRPLDHGRALAILHNPKYTGTYVYGRTKTRNVVLPGEEPRIKGRTRRVLVEDWPFVLHDHHPGYITWEQFQRNQQRLLDNCTFDHQERRGAIREEAELARRRFQAVDPENRLVARSLERDWEARLAEVERLERESAARPALSARLVDPAERARILALAQDLPSLWLAATTTQVERKQLLGFLIKDVCLAR